jgi:hypothetical protein
MRKFFAALAATVAIAGALAVGASADIGDGSVAGTGLVNFASPEFGQVTFAVTIAARGGPTGATGRVVWRYGDTIFTARVDCILVVPNPIEHGVPATGTGALVHAVLDEPSETPFGTVTAIGGEVVDNGEGAHSPPDAVIFGFELFPPPPGFGACTPTFVDFGDAFPVEHGNFVVRSTP